MANSCSSIGNCFRCNQTGHWASKCPTINSCYFCGHRGHWASNCEMKKKLTIPIPEPAKLEEVPRIRSRATLMNLEDIMFNCHLNMGFSKDMEDQIVTLMKSVGGRDRDEGRIAEYVFHKNRNSFLLGDEGHMNVLGFIIKRYISASNDILKTFLRDMYHEIPDTFDSIAKGVFGLIVVRKGNGTMCFRKPTGYGI